MLAARKLDLSAALPINAGLPASHGGGRGGGGGCAEARGL